MPPSVPTVDPSWQERRRALAAAGTAQVFDFEKWVKHRSLWKYWIAVKTLPTSHVLRSCAVPVLWVLFVSILVGIKDELEERDVIPSWFRVERITEIVQEPLTITSFALSLLLVFRTNSSYARFAEARSLWGMVLNRSRDLARQCVSFYPTSEWNGKATFVRWTISFSKCLLCHLRPYSSLRDEVSEVLSKEEIQILLAAEHPVVMCLQVLSELIEAAPITAMQRWQMHENLTKLEDMLGACERIFKTPIPLAYSRHTHRFLIIWLTILPYALWSTFDWVTLIVAPLISLLLSGINEIGIDVEEPFSLLPLAAIADTALRDCTQIVNLQLLLADRLIEARDHSLNGRVFNVVQDERDTKLAKEQVDLLPLARRSAVSMLEQVTSRINSSALQRPSLGPAMSRTGSNTAIGTGLATPRPRPQLQRHSAAAGALRSVPERPSLQRHSAMGSFNHAAAASSAAAAVAAVDAAESIARSKISTVAEDVSMPPPPVSSGAVRVDRPPSEVESEEPAGTPTIVAAPWPGAPSSPHSAVSPPNSVRSAFAAMPDSPRSDAQIGMHHVSSVPQAALDPRDARLRFYGRGEDGDGALPGGLRNASSVGRRSSGRTVGESGRRSLDSTTQHSSETLLARAARRGAALAERIRQSTRTQDP